MKHVFLINPAAGKRDRSREFYERFTAFAQARALDYEIAVSRAPGDCRGLARRWAAAGAPLRLYACGGDGTLNEVVNGAVGFPNVAVTHYPGGSGNDFIKVFHDSAPFADLEQLLDPAEAEFDLISCNGDYALNVCSLGFDARIGTEMAAYKRLPLVSGPGAYVLSALVNTVKGVHEPYTVELNGQTIAGEQTMIFVGNGRWYGGGFQPVPEADPADGLFDVLLVRGVSRLTVLRVIGSYKNGGYHDFPQIIRHFRTRSLTIRCGRENAINLDGELRRAQIVRIDLAPEKLRFFYPRTLSWAPIPRKFEQKEGIGREREKVCAHMD